MGERKFKIIKWDSEITGEKQRIKLLDKVSESLYTVLYKVQFMDKEKMVTYHKYQKKIT